MSVVVCDAVKEAVTPTVDGKSRHGTTSLAKTAVNPQNSQTQTVDNESSRGTFNLQISKTVDDNSSHDKANPQNSPTAGDDSHHDTVNPENSATAVNEGNLDHSGTRAGSTSENSDVDDKYSVYEDSVVDSDYVPDSADESDSDISEVISLVHLFKSPANRNSRDSLDDDCSDVALSTISINRISNVGGSDGGGMMVAQENDNVDNTDEAALPDDNPCDGDDALLETDAFSIDNGEEPVQQNNNGVAITTDRAAVQSRMSSLQKKKKKIHRPCNFCGQMQTNLTRHIKVVHRKEEAVVRASHLPFDDRRKFFANLRKTGILSYNKKQMQCHKPSYARERHRTTNGDLVMCGECSGFYGKKYFRRHRKKCSADRCNVPRAVPLQLMKLDAALDTEYRNEILARFSTDSAGNLCRSDPSLIRYGSRVYQSIAAKRDKATEVRRSVMADMRRIALLFLEFQKLLPSSSETSEMLERKNFEYFTHAVHSYTLTEQKDVKAGLKTALYYLIKKFASIVKASYLMQNRDDTATEIDRFLDVFALNKKLIFGDATYILNKNRQVNLRRPQSLPSEQDVTKLKTYTLNRISSLDKTYEMWDTHSYAELRDLTVSRLTLFNARRGGEPARLLLTEWKDAESDVWLRPQYSDAELKMFHDLKITYQSGKGNHLVPVLIPSDLIKAMKILSDISVREMSGIRSNNIYMFPSTQSDSHVSGWHSVNRVCVAAQIDNPDKMTATKMRHRVSTLYAGLDVSENDRTLFYKHMGHSSAVNANIYQTPLAEAEITHVGMHLKRMDGQVPCSSSEVLDSVPHQSDVGDSTVESVDRVVLTSSISRGSDSSDTESDDTEPPSKKVK